MASGSVPSDALPEGTGPTTDGPKEAEAQADGRNLETRKDQNDANTGVTDLPVKELASRDMASEVDVPLLNSTRELAADLEEGRKANSSNTGNSPEVVEDSKRPIFILASCMICVFFVLIVIFAYYPFSGDPWPWSEALRNQSWGNFTFDGDEPWEAGGKEFFGAGGKPLLTLGNPSAWGGIANSGETLLGILQNHSWGGFGLQNRSASNESSSASSASSGSSGSKKQRKPGELWGNSSEVFPLLGKGLCMRTTWSTSELIPKYNTWVTHQDVMQLFTPGDHAKCEADCQSKPWCTGFVTFGEGENAKCSMVWEDEGVPSAYDWNPAFKCYWRKRWHHNSVGVYAPPNRPVPKIIWTYWEDMKKVDWGHRIEATTQSFLDLCHRSWRKMNPDWKVHILNQYTVWDYISKKDLPEGFDNLMIQHRSDAIRLALIVKYGGVWIDATILLLKPLDSVIKEDQPSLRHFYVNGGTPNMPTIKTRYSRYSTDFHVENWFMAAPPQDPFMVRSMDCVRELHKYTDVKELSTYPWLFTKRQMGDLDGLGLWKYVATSACFFKVLDDDREITRWWLSPSVHRSNFMGHLSEAWFGYGNTHQVLVDLLYTHQPYVVKELTEGPLLLLKFTHDSRAALIDPITPMQIYGCWDTSWSATLKAIGLNTTDSCNEMKTRTWWG